MPAAPTMAQKSDNVDIDELFAGIEDSASPTPISNQTGSKAKLGTTSAEETEQDILADLDALAAPRPISRSSTSRPPSSAARRSIEKSRTPATSGYGLPIRRDSADVRSSTPSPPKRDETSTPSGETSGGGGWGWGSLWSTATAAAKTAEGLVKEIQQSEEGKKWVTQVKGNADVLRGLAGEVRSKALPGLTNLLHTLAPPISSHEQLRIHITHDLENYPFIDTVVYGVFDRVMQQVEGGDLLVVQRGSGSRPRSTSESGLFSGGPWWKATETRNLNATHGLQEGIKLARAAAESYSHDFDAKSSVSENPSKDNPTSKSNIFLAIQPAIYSQTPPATSADETTHVDSDNESIVTFAIHLLDPEHEISFSTVSQTLPAQWLEWLDAPPSDVSRPGEWALPVVIQDIVDAGGVDPREWIVEWVEEAVGLAVGTVAQRYVAKRMRVGEAGEMRRLVREEGGGEEARAVGM